MFSRVRIWIEGHPRSALALFTLIALGPFLTKPFNIDDPLFIWAARQIQAHPGDPYGFDVNWYGFPQPMWAVTQNPPVTCYFLALTAGMLGWSEIGLHGAMLLPAITAILGTWRLAKHLCRQPLLAAVVTLFTPVFLVSANTVMCDVMLLACWIWAVVFWLEGSKTGSVGKLWAAGLMVALAAMTKYYGACLMPLLTAHAVMQRKPFKSWLPFLLLIPLAVLATYELAAQAAYGSGLLQGAIQYVTHASSFHVPSKIQSGICGLAFTGGGLAAVVFFAPLLWRKRSLLGLTVMLAVVMFTMWFNAGFWGKYEIPEGSLLIRAKIQMAFWITAGFAILALAAADTWQHRDANSSLLLLWVGGTFCFASFCNWTVNERSILPMTPAVAILIVRRLEMKPAPTPGTPWLAVTLCLGFAFLVEYADFSGAVATRRSTEAVMEKYAQPAGARRFQGHWGFQYYMN